MSAMLEVAGFSVCVPGRAAAPLIVDDVSLHVAKGEILALVGESGSGKTSLARAMFGLIRPSAGRMTVNGVTLAGFSRQAFYPLRRHMALLFQNAVASFNPRMRVAAIITEGRAGADAASLLARVGLDDAFLPRYPHELSGGQAKRVALARALASKPAMIVADEPTAGLDVSVQGEILNLLLDMRDGSGLAVLLITHNLPVVRHVSNRIIVMYLGCIVESGPTDMVFQGPAHPYTSALLLAEPSPDPRHRQTHAPVQGDSPSLYARPAGCGFHPRCPRATAPCRTQAPMLREIAPARFVRCHDPLMAPA